jgi:glycosyltransferase involved in cell wall biosynthesis
VTLHGSGFEEFLERHRAVLLVVLGRADGIIVLADGHRELLPQHLKERAVLVPNTVASDVRLPTPVPPHPRALFAGEISTRKGVDILLQAWPLVRSAVPGAELCLAGPEGDVKTSTQPGVRWLGSIDNESVRDLLRNSRVAVLPSRREAMPMFILEAMAVGRPVVSTPIGAIPETVGSGGLIVPVGDVLSLAEALSRVLEPDGTADRMADAARDRFQSRYSSDLALGRLKEMYDRVAPMQRRASVQRGPNSGAQR